MARAEVFERPNGKTIGFGIIWIGKHGPVTSGYLHHTKARAIELATNCGASKVTDIGPLPVPE